MREWETIKTAPKDGTLIDVIVKNRDGGKLYRVTDVKYFDGRWCDLRRCPHVSYDDEWQTTGAFTEDYDEQYADVIKWMPIPELLEE